MKRRRKIKKGRLLVAILIVVIVLGGLGYITYDYIKKIMIV